MDDERDAEHCNIVFNRLSEKLHTFRNAIAHVELFWGKCSAKSGEGITKHLFQFASLAIKRYQVLEQVIKVIDGELVYPQA